MLMAAGGMDTSMDSDLHWAPDDYMSKRLDEQIEWYDKNSSRAQSWFKRLRILEIALAVSIPFLVGYISDETPAMRFTVGLTGVVVAIISGMLTLNRYQENWIEYRTTCESLRHHKFTFLAKAGPYSGDGAFRTLVENVERLISQENTKWAEINEPKKKEQSHG